MAAQDEDGVLVAELESLGRQMTKALGGRAEEQGDHAGGPHVCGQGLVGQAALEERTPIVLVEHGSGVRPEPIAFTSDAPTAPVLNWLITDSTAAEL